LKIEAADKSAQHWPALQSYISRQGLLFNSQAWLRNYDPSNIRQCVILNNNNDVIGCFIYYRFQKAGFRLIITPPFAPHIELSFINPAESIVGKNSFVKELMQLISEYFKKQKVSFINLNFPEETGDTQPFIWNGFESRARYSYLIDLSQSEEAIRENLSSEKRKSLNKAKKDGIITEACTDPEIIFGLALKSLARNGKDKNLEVMRKIIYEFANASNSFSYVAYLDNKPVGVSFCVMNATKAMYLFGGFDSESKHHGAGVSCMWESVMKAKSLGLSHFDFEGSMNASIERYFREFGAQLVSYHSVEKVKPLFGLLLKLKGHRSV
jgi:hypothetical protein